MYAVEIVGGGLTGAFLAWQLAERGWRVVARDASRKPWIHVCGGLVSAKTVRTFPFLEHYVLRTIDGARIHAGSEEIVVERRSVAYVLDRRALVKDLLERAEAAGADVFLGERGPKRDGVTLVGADGVLSAVRRDLGLSSPSYVMGAQIEVQGHFDNLVDVYFLPGCDFFGWVIPVDDERARVGVASSGNPLPFLRKLLRMLNVRKRRSSPRGRPIPVDKPVKRVVFGNIALVGDAVPQTKATTGGGIYYGLLAARALADGIHAFFSTGTMSSYQRFHTSVLFPRLHFHYLLRKWFLRGDMESLLARAKDAGLPELLSCYGDMDDPFFILNPKVWWVIAQIYVPGVCIPQKQHQNRRRSSPARAWGRKQTLRRARELEETPKASALPKS